MVKDGSSHVKKLTSTMGRSRSPTKRGPQREDFTMDLQNLRGHIEKSNKEIIELKQSVEFHKKATSG